MPLRGTKVLGPGREECIDGISLLSLLHIVPNCTVLCCAATEGTPLVTDIEDADGDGDEEERPRGPSILLGIIYP